MTRARNQIYAVAALEEAPGPALPRSRISRLRLGLARRQERRAEPLAAAMAWEPARQSRAVAAESDFQMERETVRESAWEFSQALAFRLLLRLPLPCPSQLFLELGMPSSSGLISSFRLFPLAQDSAISSLFVKR